MAPKPKRTVLQSKPSTGDLLDDEEKEKVKEWIEKRAPDSNWRDDLLKYGPDYTENVPLPSPRGSPRGSRPNNIMYVDA